MGTNITSFDLGPTRWRGLRCARPKSLRGQALTRRRLLRQKRSGATSDEVRSGPIADSWPRQADACGDRSNLAIFRFENDLPAFRDYEASVSTVTPQEVCRRIHDLFAVPVGRIS